jgi:2-oxo-4-hydroxy-4-carboxy-5-ureidoimidazoline decarboxylase
MTLAQLNVLDRDVVSREFLRCCGSTRWASMMTAARPFASVDAMDVTADVIWAWLTPADWLEAFAAHPRIGRAGQSPVHARQAPDDGRSAGLSGPRTVAALKGPHYGPEASARDAGREPSEQRSAAWSDQEQVGARAASSHVLDRLAVRNREYEERFGYIFIVCATGKSGDEMLALLERRLDNAPDEELRIAAAEQAKITRLRLRLISEGDS